MKLTVKAKEAFEKWYFKQDYPVDFQLLVKSMQWGVLQDWFDSVGLMVECRANLEDEFSWYVAETLKHYQCHTAKTRPEGRNKAITEANEIYNGNIS